MKYETLVKQTVQIGMAIKAPRSERESELGLLLDGIHPGLIGITQPDESGTLWMLRVRVKAERDN